MHRTRAIRVACVGVLCLAAFAACSKDSPTKPQLAAYQIVQTWGGSGSGDGQFSFPHDVAVDGSGNVFVADAGNHRIQKFTGAGAYVSQWGDSGSGNGQFIYPMHLAVDAGGNVYVADHGNNRIQKFTGDGAYITQWGSFGPGDGQFESPWGVAVDAADGSVYVVDDRIHRVQKFTSTGAYLTQWQVPTNAHYEIPKGVAVDDSGNVYIVISNNNFGGYPGVQKFASDGTFLTKWGEIGTSKGQVFDPDGIAVDAAGNVYVADTDNWRLQKYSRMGAFITQWPSGRNASGACAPGGIAVDSHGNVYDAEWNLCSSVHKFAPVR